MEVIVENFCGIDVHQKLIVCCILDGPLDMNKPQKKTYLWYNNKETPTSIDMDSISKDNARFFSTGQYWNPIFNIFYVSNLTLILANPQHIKNLPSRKTDTNDEEWIAQLCR